MPDNDFKLPSLAPAAIKILQLVENPDVEMQEMVNAIELDPTLAVRLIRLSNSSLFGFSREITSIRQAVIVLGLRAVKTAALSFSIIKGLGRPISDCCIANCWRRVLTNAMACRMIANLLGRDVDDAFLAGLFQDIGALVLAINCPHEYRQVFERYQMEGAPELIQIERAVLQTDHVEVAVRLLRHWRIPESIVREVERHHEIDVTTAFEATGGPVAAVMAVAEHITNFLGAPTAMNLAAFDAVGHHLHGRGSEVDKFLQELELQIRNLADFFELSLPPGRTHDEIMEKARQLSMNLRVLDRGVLPIRLRQELALGRRQNTSVTVILLRFYPLMNAVPVTPVECPGLMSGLAAELGRLTRESDSLFYFSADTLCAIVAGVAPQGLEIIAQRLHEGFEGMLANLGEARLEIHTAISVLTIPNVHGIPDGDTVINEAYQMLEQTTSTHGIVFGTYQLNQTPSIAHRLLAGNVAQRTTG